MKIKTLSRIFAGALTALAVSGALAQSKPTELKVGITTFLSGPASVFGVPGMAAADLYIEQLNAAGGINGVKIVPTYIDEGVGADKLLSEYRRVVQETGTKVMLSAVSSGNCNIIAPVEMVSTVLYLLKTKPDIKTIAVMNQDYAWGRDSWELFRNALLALKPDVKIVAELFPKFGATDYSTEISRLQALHPDVILSTSWGGDLDTFVRQASQRGLMKSSLLVLPLAESSLERLGTALPDGVIVGARGDHYFLHPQYKDEAKLKNFTKKFQEKTGAYPIYPVFHMVQALDGLVAGYQKAIKANKGQWPSTEQVADAMRGLEFRGLTGTVKIREDGQGLEDQLLGVTHKVAGYNFPVLEKITIYPADLISTPVGQKSPEWVKTIKPELLKNPRFKQIN